MMNKKAIVMSFGLLCLQATHAMDQQGALTTYLSEMANAGLCFVTANANSLATTVTNQLSDEAAFAKLGFPPINDVNKAELAKFMAIKERHNADIAGRQFNGENFIKDAAYIERRHGFCHRLVSAVPLHTKGTELALFALEHYQSVMNSFEVACLVSFVELKKESSQQEATALNFQLSHFANSHDSQLLNSILQRSKSAENKEEKKDEGEEQKEEEQKDDAQ